MSKETIYSLKELAENLNLNKPIILYHIEKDNLKADKVSKGKYEVQPENIKKFLTKRAEEKRRKCSECYYHSYFNGMGWGCGYSFMENKLRGCSPVNCKKFRRAKK